jgi:uroporphyrinogen decarboxylase
MNPSDRFIRACLGKTVDRVPVWLMRQAGRTLPEYRALRRKHSFLDVCRTPDLAVEATLQPLDRFGMDAAILFSDILVLVEALGVEVSFAPGQGPRLSRAIRSAQDVDLLRLPDPGTRLGYVMEILRQLKGCLRGRAALTGFSGAPFTLAAYLIEGGASHHFHTAKRFMYQEPETFRRLMEILSQAVGLYLEAQIDAGAQAVQIFDTWAGLLSPRDYRAFVLPHMQPLLERVNRKEVPTIHFSLGTSTLLDAMADTGARVMSLDWKIDIGEARHRLGPRRPVQGNLDPLALFLSPDRLSAAAREILDKADADCGFIFNLGHGLHPETPLENVEVLLDTVRSYPLPIREEPRVEEGTWRRGGCPEQATAFSPG